MQITLLKDGRPLHRQAVDDGLTGSYLFDYSPGLDMPPELLGLQIRVDVFNPPAARLLDVERLLSEAMPADVEDWDLVGQALEQVRAMLRPFEARRG